MAYLIPNRPFHAHRKYDIKDLSLDKFVNLFQGPLVKIIAGPTEERKEFTIPCTLAMEYSEYFARQLTNTTGASDEQQVILAHNIWPETMQSFLQVLSRQAPNLDPVPGFTHEHSQERNGEYQRLGPRLLNSLDRIIDLLHAALYLEFQAGDVEEVVKAELSSYLTSTANRAQLTDNHCYVVFGGGNDNILLMRDIRDIVGKVVARMLIATKVSEEAVKNNEIPQATPFSFEESYEYTGDFKAITNGHMADILIRVVIEGGHMLGRDLLNDELFEIRRV